MLAHAYDVVVDVDCLIRLSGWPGAHVGRIPQVKLTRFGVKSTPVKLTIGFDVVNLSP